MSKEISQKKVKDEMVTISKTEYETMMARLNRTVTIKDEILKILKDHKPMTIDEISEKVGTTTKVVSSYLTSLRNDGKVIISVNINKERKILMLNDEQQKILNLK